MGSRGGGWKASPGSRRTASRDPGRWARGFPLPPVGRASQNPAEPASKRSSAGEEPSGTLGASRHAATAYVGFPDGREGI